MAFKIPKYYLTKLFNRLRHIINKRKIYPVISNVNRVDESDYTKRALLIYLVWPFLLKDDFSGHRNRRRVKQIAILLDELGYIVDVVDIRNRKFRPSKNYGIVICNRVSDIPLNNDAIRIYLATSMCFKMHNKNLLKRHERLRKRRGFQIQPRRLYPELMPYVTKSNAIIGIGNAYSWKEVFTGTIYQFNNYGFKETEFFLDSKDFDTARKNFLFFASKSQMQKGLDLLLDIFPKHPYLHLYICSEFEKEEDFCECYHKELYETPNIHPVGWVTVNSSKYKELIYRCAYIIYPTCSEGQAGSVVQCMYSGLIPLVTREAGINTEDFGITYEIAWRR